MSDEGIEGTPQHDIISPEKYLNNIGEENKKNVERLRNSIKETSEELQIPAYMLAVGGTVEKQNPHLRKDVDIRLGLQLKYLADNNQSFLNRYQQFFNQWKEVTLKAVNGMSVENEYEIEIDPPHPDPEHEWMAANDGMIKIIPKTGVPVEILCHQPGSIARPPYVTLFDNTRTSAA